MGAERRLLEEPRHELVAFDVVNILLLQRAFPASEAEAERSIRTPLITIIILCHHFLSQDSLNLELFAFAELILPPREAHQANARCARDQTSKPSGNNINKIHAQCLLRTEPRQTARQTAHAPH